MMSAMKVTHAVRYDAPVHAVWEMLSDPVFRERSTLAQGAHSVSVAVEGPRISIDMVNPNDDVPGFARAIAGDSLRLLQTEEWDPDALRAAFSITSAGMPGGVTGTRTLVDHGDATLDTFDGHAQVRVPLVGGKLEGLVARRLKQGWDVEHGVGRDWLGGRR
jgi:uncharacterized protein YndB with AHSA1/START domain